MDIFISPNKIYRVLEKFPDYSPNILSADSRSQSIFYSHSCSQMFGKVFLVPIPVPECGNSISVIFMWQKFHKSLLLLITDLKDNIGRVKQYCSVSCFKKNNSWKAHFRVADPRLLPESNYYFVQFPKMFKKVEMRCWVVEKQFEPCTAVKSSLIPINL